MVAKDVIGIIIIGLLSVGIIVLSIIMMRGKGSKLIAGYNTSPHKEEYNGALLSKFIGKILLPCGALLPLIAIGEVLKIDFLSAVYVIVVIILCIFSIIYANVNKKFKNNNLKK